MIESTMKSLLAALLGSTLITASVLGVPAYANDVWEFNDYKRCRAAVTFDLPAETDGWLSVEQEPDTVKIIFYRKNLAKLEAAVRFLKKCRSWAWDRNRGKAVYSTPKQMKEELER
jgi:hypothetical protein